MTEAVKSEIHVIIAQNEHVEDKENIKSIIGTFAGASSPTWEYENITGKGIGTKQCQQVSVARGILFINLVILYHFI